MTKRVITIAAALVFLVVAVPLSGQWQGDTRITDNSGSSYMQHYGGWGIAADNSDVHITWYDYTDAPYYIRYFTFPIGSPTSTTNGEQVSTTYGYYPSIAVYDGTVDVSWYYSSSPYYLHTREKNGSWGSIINHGDPGRSCYYPAIAFDSDGDLHCIFNRYGYSTYPPVGYSVYYQNKSSGAGSYSSPVLAFDPHVDGGSPSSYYYAYYPSACITSDDVIHISVAHNNGYRLKHVWSDDGGATWNHETIGATYTAYYSYGTSICCDSDDNLYIAYVGYDIPRQIYVATNASGSWVSTQVSNSTYNYTYYPSICCDANDNIWVAWDDRSGTTYEIHYNKYDGSWQGDSALTSDDGNYSRYSNIAADENGNVHIAWYDRRDGNYEIYYNWYKAEVGPTPPFVDTMFCEYFEGSWLPPGWTQIINDYLYNGSYPCTWFHGSYSPLFHHASWGAYCWWGVAASPPVYQDEWLMTPPTDLSGYNPQDSVDLILNSAYYGSVVAYNYICVSTDGGQTWIDTLANLAAEGPLYTWTYIDDYPNPLEYRISQYIGETIMIGFNYYWQGGTGKGIWTVDDVCLIVSGGGGGAGEDSLDLAIEGIIRPHTIEEGGVPFRPEILVVNNLDTTAHALMRCKIKDRKTSEQVYEDVLSIVPVEPGENFIDGFANFTPEGGKEYNALFVLEHPDDVNEENNHKDKDFETLVGIDVTPDSIALPADLQEGPFAPTARYEENAGAETEANLICEILDESSASVYKESISHTFMANDIYTAEFEIPTGLAGGTYTITFWAENPEDGSNISHPPISKTFEFTPGIAETPVPQLTSLEVVGHTVNFSLANATNVSIRVYDVAGKLVATLVEGSRDAGYYNVDWNTTGVASGVYFVKMLTPDFSASDKIVVLY